MSAYVGIGGHIGYVLAYVDIGALCEGRFVYVVVSTCSLWAGGEGGGHAPTRTHIDQHHPTRTSAPQLTEAYVSALLSYPQHTCLPLFLCIPTNPCLHNSFLGLGSRLLVPVSTCSCLPISTSLFLC